VGGTVGIEIGAREIGDQTPRWTIKARRALASAPIVS
jgi:hypothetical protein